MSHYKIPGGQDLTDIFMPISAFGATTAPFATGYKTSMVDLQLIYAAKVVGSTSAPLTHYKSSNYGNQDLNTVFQSISSPIARYLQTGGSVVDSGSIVTITWSNGIGGTLKLNSVFTVNNLVVTSLIGGGSGGDGGLNASSSSQGGAGGNGGKAGEIKSNLSLFLDYINTYIITAGAGGVAGTANGGTGGIGGNSEVNVTTSSPLIASGNFLVSGTGGVGGTTAVPGGGFGDSITTSSGAGGGGGALNNAANAGGSSSGGGDGGGSGGRTSQLNGDPPFASEIGNAIGGGGGGGGGGGVSGSALGTGAKGSNGRPGQVIITITY
jgi:hypothetical protein